MLDYFVGMAASIILNTIKNPESAAKFKAVLLKIRNEISRIYPLD